MRRGTGCPLAVLLLVLAVPLTLPAAAAGQETARQAWNPRPGDWSLAVALENLGTSPQAGLTLWRQTTPTVALGLELRAAATVDRPPEGVDAENAVTATLGLGPAMRSYWWSGRSTSPFFLAGARATWSWVRDPASPAPGDERVAVGLDGIIGLGVDWFFTERMSLGAHTGISGGYRTFWDPDGPRGGDRFQIGLGTSAISLQLYF